MEAELRREAKLTWQLERQVATPAELGLYLDRVHSLGGEYLIHGKTCLSVERAVDALVQWGREQQ